MQQRRVPACQPDHRFVYRRVPVGVQFHRFADDICGLRCLSSEKSFFIHGIKQFSVRRLEAVDLGDRPADDDADGVGKIVFF